MVKNTCYFLLLFMVCSCSSGGTSSGAISSGIDGVIESFSAESALKTDEYYESSHLGDISVLSGYLYSNPTSLSEVIAGNDISIALLDTGIDDHGELSDQLALSRDVTSLSSSHNSANYNAGIMLAERDGSSFHGIAYNASLIDIKTHDVDDGGNIYSSTSWVTSGIDQAVLDDADIINIRNNAINDYDVTSADYTDLLTSISNATASSVEKIIVTEIGDTSDGDRDPLKIAEIAADTSTTNGLMLTVGGVDSSGDIASYSRYCRSVKDYCLTTYTDSITSLDLSNTTTIDSTTGSAASTVSGVLALMMEAFPATSKEDLVTIMLRYSTPKFTDDEVASGSARDVGSTGDLSEVYGWGILSLEDIFETSAGVVSVSFIDPEIRYSIDGSAIYVPASLGFVSASLSSSLTRVMTLDEYNRPFWLDLSDRVNSESSTVNYFNNFSSMKKDYEKLGVYNNKLNLTYNSESFYQDDIRSGEFSFNGKVGSHLSFDYAQGDLAKYNSFFDAKEDEYFSNPYLGLTDENLSSLKLTSRLSNNLVISANFLNEGDVVAGMENSIAYLGKSSSFALSYTDLIEDESVLGMSGSEAFSFGDSTNTQFYGIAAKLKLTNKLDLLGQYYQGESEYTGNGGFFESMSASTRSFTVSAKQAMSQISSFSLTYHVPFYIYDGEANLNIPTSLSADGKIVTESFVADLNDSPDPLVKVAYEKNLSDSSKASVEFYSQDIFGEEPSEAVLFNLNKTL